MPLSNEKGLTLIEIVIVLIITLVLASLAVVGPEFLRKENITRGSRELLGDLQKIRQDAMTKSSLPNSCGFGIRFANSKSYTIFEFNDNKDGANFQYDGSDEEANPIQRNLPSSIVISINGAEPRDDVLIYDKLGIPRTDRWALAQRTIVVKHESSSSVQQKCLVVSTNRVREGVWDGSSCQQQ